MSHQDGENHLQPLIRSADPARFFAAQFIPGPQRADILTLYAFDLEIAKIARTTREPMAGEIRLQWWREVFQGERDAEAAASPLANTMLDLTRRHTISPDVLGHYLDGCIFDLYDDAIEDQQGFEAYAGQTDGTILQLSCLVLDRARSAQAAELSGYLACMLSLWHRVIRPLLTDRTDAQTRAARYLPPQICEAAGMSANPFLQSQSADQSQAIQQICAFAESYRQRAIKAAAAVPATLRPAFLQLAPVTIQLAKATRLSRRNGPAADISTAHLIWHLWRASKRWPCF
uniref:squalene/phytoene synthase family protein n=1 Tax=Pararhizobium sp. IMCC3301 TaxID=3067904 RepID=UPI002741993F|nr:squalene/phytoene synthase family protein [Pararhizobium sp. IMCC3301]